MKTIFRVTEVAMLLLFFAFVIIMSGCDMLWSPWNHESSDGTKPLCDNYLTFNGYNMLEVIISTDESFVLFDPINDEKVQGVGEWIKGETAIPISFASDTDMLGSNEYDAIIIYYNTEGCNYLHADKCPVVTPFIAKITSDYDNPELRWWISGNYHYNDTYGEAISVQYVTGIRSEYDKWLYIPEAAYRFYSALESEQVSYTCEQGNFVFDCTSGLGEWTVNNTIIPIIVAFDKENFMLSVCYNTLDQRQGKVIFEGIGQSIDEFEAIYTITLSPDYYSGVLSELIIQKQIQ